MAQFLPQSSDRQRQAEFDPGDALLFDERMIHRTFLSESMTEERLAVECWFFDAAHKPASYTALLV